MNYGIEAILLPYQVNKIKVQSDIDYYLRENVCLTFSGD